MFLEKLIDNMTKYIQLLSNGSINVTLVSTKVINRFKTWEKDHNNFFLNKKQTTYLTKLSYQSTKYKKQYLQF